MPSYILKCTVGDKHFICNRNHTWINTLSPGVSDWWQANEVSIISDCDNVEILQVLPDIDNDHNKDQWLLNEVKNEYRQIDTDLQHDEHICDIIIKDEVRKRKKWYKERERQLRGIYHLLTKKEKYAYRYDFFNYAHWEKLLNTPRYKWEGMKITDIKKYAYCMYKKEEWKEDLEFLMKYRRKILGDNLEQLYSCEYRTITAYINGVPKSKKVLLPPKQNDDDIFSYYDDYYFKRYLRLEQYFIGL